jgi:hypothetical protein
MSGLLASLALIGGFVALTLVLSILIWLTFYCLSRLGIGT